MSLRTLQLRARLIAGDLLDRLRPALVPGPGSSIDDRLELARFEERILFSATPSAAVAEIAQVAPAELQQPTDAVQQGESTDPSHGLPLDAALQTIDQSLADPDSHGDRSVITDQTDAAVDVAAVRRELVFVDLSVTDVDQWLAELTLEDPARSVEVVTIDSGEDGISRITTALQNRQNLDAVHIISHGTGGSVFLGDVELNLQSLTARAGEIAAWNDSLQPDADVLFYGCELASNEDGRLLLESMAVLCDCDVSASIDDTGADSFGGDWDLEFDVGEIETGVIVSSSFQSNWLGLLSNAPVIDLDDDDSSTLAGSDFAVIYSTPAANVAIADTDATVTDIDSGLLEGLVLQISGLEDGANEVVRFGSNDIALSTSSDQNVTVDSTNFRVQVSASGGTADVTISNPAGGAVIPVSSVESALRNISYRNDAASPSGRGRTITIQSSDGTNTSIVATSTIVFATGGITPSAGDPVGYALPDNAADLYVFSVDDSTVPTASTMSLSQQFNGEGMAYRAFNNSIYAFDSNDLYRIDVTDGTVTLIKSNAVAATVQGASFYVDPSTEAETFYVLEPVGSENGPTNLVVMNPDTGDVISSTPITGPQTHLDSIAIHPTSGLAYGTDDKNSSTVDGSSTNTDIYQINLSTGAVTFVVGTDLDVDGEALSFGDDGQLYIEEDRGSTGLRRIYRVNLSTGALTEVAGIPGSGDVEGIAFNAGLSVFAPDLDLDADDSAGSGNDYETTYTEDGPAVQIADDDITITDGGSGFRNATITLTNAQSGDQLSIGTLPAGLISSIDTSVSGEIKVILASTNLNTGAPGADLQTAIRAVTYRTTSDTPSTVDRSIEITVEDHTGYVSNTGTTTVHVVAANDPPAINLDLNDSSLAGGNDYATTFTDGGAAVAIADTDVTITDADDTELSSLTLTFDSVPDGDNEVLQIRGTDFMLGPASSTSTTVTSGGPNITVVYSAATRTFTITSEDGDDMEIDDVESLLSEAVYSNSSTTPTTGDRQIAITINDGDDTASAVSTITVVATNDNPTLVLPGSGITYTENQSPQQIDATATASDPEAEWNGGTLAVQITSNAEATDRLQLQSGIEGITRSGTNILSGGQTIGTVNAATVTGSSTLTITFNSSATNNDVQAVARAISYDSNSEDSSELQRTVTFTLTDEPGASVSATQTVGVVAANDAPTITSVSDQTINEDSATAALAFTIGDIETAADSLTVTASSNDSTIIPQSGLSLGGSGASRTITVTPAADQHGGPVTITLTVDDGDDTTQTTFTVTVDPLADTPSVTNSSTDEDTQSSTGLVISRNAADSDEVTDFQITGITGGTLFQNNGTTEITNGDFITFAQGNAGLRFTPDENSNANGSFNVQASTSGNASGLGGGLATATITVNPVNDPPALDLDANGTGTDFSNTFTEGGSPVAIADSDVTVTDIDDTAMSSLMITVAGESDGNKEVITIGGASFQLGKNSSDTVSAGGTTFDVTFTKSISQFLITNNGGGDMPIADLQTLLAGATYENTAALPTTGPRTLTFTASDGDDDSNDAVSTITVNQTVGSAEWDITGDATVDEGGTATYTLALTGTLASGENAAIDFSLVDIDTNAADYELLTTSVNTAIASRGDLAFNGATLTFTSDGSSMSDLTISIAATDDALIEGPESYRLQLGSPNSTTGESITLNTTLDQVETEIQDTAGDGGATEIALWSLSGPASVTEGGNAVFTLSLAGTLQAGENAGVDLALADISTTSVDYGDFSSAIQTAVDSRSDLSFDAGSGRVTFTSAGSAMSDLVISLPIVDDPTTEGPEQFQISLASPGSTSGAASGLTAQDSITTTIEDNVATVSGTVFEDVNYGGGAGRDLAAAESAATGYTIRRSGVRVELYDQTGSFVTSTLTGTSGDYSFTVDEAEYTVRVVNDTVTSTRVGSDGTELLVQTFRADSLGEIAGTGTTRVGGEAGSNEDAAANLTNQNLAALQNVDSDSDGITEMTQSIVTGNISGNVTGIDFGFNASTIVNTNDSGQGSLRQFLLNANRLTDNAALNQTGLASGVETSVFMLPGSGDLLSRAVDAAFNSSGPDNWFVIRPDSPLPTITDAVNLDATTQASFTGTPRIEVDGQNAGATADGFSINGSGTTIRGFAINRFGDDAIQIAGGPGNVVAGNRIGTDITGSTTLGNGSGIEIQSAGNRIGGTSSSDANLITGSTDFGIGVSGAASTGNSILGNSIFANGALGIDLGLDGVTDNDTGDSDSGPNDLLNSPRFVFVQFESGTATVHYRLDVPAGDYRVEFFSNAAADPTGNGEGQTLVHAELMTHDGLDPQNFVTSFAVADNSILSATVTEDLPGSFGSTSEFSHAAIQPFVDLDPSDPNGPADFAATFIEDGPPVLIADSDARVTDVDSGTLSQLVITLTNPLDGADEVLAADTSGTSITAGFNNGTLTLSGPGTPGEFQQVLRTVTYSNASQNPGPTDRIITVQLTDADGHSGNVATSTITVVPVPDAPVAVADAWTLDEDDTLVVSAAEGVLLNDSDADGDPIDAVLDAGPQNGTLTLNDDGSFTYTPDENYTGADSFTYHATDDGGLDSGTVTVSLTINPVNDAPVGRQESYEVDQLTTLKVPASDGVLVNDTDVDGDSLKAVLLASPDHGRILLREDGAFVYQPRADFFGVDEFTYIASDGELDSEVVTVRIVVNRTITALPDVEPVPVPDDTSSGPSPGEPVPGVPIPERNDPGPNQTDPGGPIRPPENTAPSSTSPSDDVPSIAARDTAAGGWLRRIGVPRLPVLQTTEELAAPELAPQAVDLEFFSSLLSDQLDALNDDLGKGLGSNFVIGTAALVGTSLSIGYVALLLRSSSLAVAMATSLPAWTRIDPLPVLEMAADVLMGAEDPESLSDILMQSKQLAPA